MYTHVCVNDVCIHVLIRDEKEGRKKQGQTNNKAKQHSTPKAGVHVLMRDEKEGRKKQARSNKQGKATQQTQGRCIHMLLMICTGNSRGKWNESDGISAGNSYKTYVFMSHVEVTAASLVECV